VLVAHAHSTHRPHPIPPPPCACMTQGARVEQVAAPSPIPQDVPLGYPPAKEPPPPQPNDRPPAPLAAGVGNGHRVEGVQQAGPSLKRAAVMQLSSQPEAKAAKQGGGSPGGAPAHGGSGTPLLPSLEAVHAAAGITSIDLTEDD
jgi:hypothetical protein